MRAFRITPPRAAPEAILRPRLLGLLRLRFDTPVMTVVGAAGYGKTTLLAQAITENALAPAGIDVWLRCEPADTDAGHLISGFAAALDLRSDLSGGAAVTSIRDALWSRSPQPVALVLDDVHEISPESTGAGLLDTITDALPANAHIVFAARGAPPVRLARRIAGGDVVAIAGDDLLFDASELAVVGERRGVDPTALARTGGWPALAALVSRAGPDVTERYVWEEVAGRLSDEAREVLAALVALGGADDAVVGAALGRSVSLDGLLAGVPLIARDHEGWCEPHALWGPVLANHFDPGTITALRCAAVETLRAQGRYTRAATLLLGGDGLDDRSWSALANVITDGCRVNASLAADIPLATWERNLPRDRREEPEAWLLRATVARRSGAALADAEALLQRAWDATRTAGRLDAETSAMSQLAHVAWWRDDLATMAAILRRAEERAEAGTPLDPALMALADAILADIRGDDQGMLDALVDIDERAGRDTFAAAEWFRARALVGLGRSGEGIVHADRAAASADAAFQSARLSMLSTRWYAGRPIEAMSYRERATPGDGALPRDLFLANLMLAVGHAHLGDLDAARVHFQRAASHVAAVEGSRPQVYLAAVDAVLLLAAGDETAAGVHASAAVERLDELGLEQGLRVLRPLLAPMYLLCPSVRSAWDTTPLGPDRLAARAAARALAGAREGTRQTTRPEPGLVLSNLPLNTAAELAARTADVDLGRWLLDACTTRARDALRAHAMSEDAQLARGARDLLRVLPTPPAHAVTLRLLGPAVIEHDDSLTHSAMHPDWRRERVRSLLAFLVVHRTTTRDSAIVALWPDLDASAGSQNLRRTLNYLHGVLEPNRRPGDAPWFVRSDGDTLRLVADGLSVDAWELDELLDRASVADAAGAPSQALDALDAALALWRGAFLADLFEEWTVGERDRLRARFLAASVRAGELQLGNGNVDRALAIATRALDAEPWSEPAHRLAIAAHLGRGDRASARRAYERCKGALEELGVEPDPSTEMLVRSMQRGAHRTG